MTPSPNPDDEQPRTTRAAIRRKHRQDLIVADTEAELETTGIHGTTLERIGERVGLSRAALYYYVDSRDDLLTLVLDLLAAHEPSALLIRHQERYARQLIADAIADGSLRPIEQAAASAVLFGTIATIHRGYDPEGRLTLDVVVDSALDLILQGWLRRVGRAPLLGNPLGDHDQLSFGQGRLHGSDLALTSRRRSGVSCPLGSDQVNPGSRC